MSNELEQIRHVMRTNPDVYWGNRDMQSRLAELSAAEPAVRPVESESGGGTLPVPLDPEASRSGLEATMGSAGKALVAEWTQFGDKEFRNAVRVVQGTVHNMLDGMSDRAMAVFMERFDRLPDACITAVYLHLSLGKPGYIEDATDAQVQSFASTDEGGELVREWGYSAPRKVAIIRHRFARATADMGDAKGHFLSWWNGLSAAEAKSILREIAR